MERKQLIRSIATFAGWLAAIGGLLAFALVTRAHQVLIGPAFTERWGWLVPLSSGLVIFGVAWALSSHPQRSEKEIPGLRPAPCEHCGKAVMGEWRLCPYCGMLLTESISPAPAEAPSPARVQSL